MVLKSPAKDETEWYICDIVYPKRMAAMCNYILPSQYQLPNVFPTWHQQGSYAINASKISAGDFGWKATSVFSYF